MFVSVIERQRAILEDGCHHTVVWQRYCKKSGFRPHIFCASGNVCNLTPSSVEAWLGYRAKVEQGTGDWS